MMTGGLSVDKEITPEVEQLTATIRESSEKQAGKTFDRFVALAYKSQVVAGMNYFIKVEVSDTECVHLCVYKPLPHTNEGPKLTAQQLGKTKDDEIEYFGA